MKSIFLFVFCLLASIGQAQISLIDTITTQLVEAKKLSEVEYRIGKWKDAANIVLSHSTFSELRTNRFRHFSPFVASDSLYAYYLTIQTAQASHILWFCMYADNSFYIFDDLITNKNISISHYSENDMYGYVVTDTIANQQIAIMPDVRLRSSFEILANSNGSDVSKDSATIGVGQRLTSLCKTGLAFQNASMILPRLYIVGDDGEMPFRILTYSCVRNDLSSKCFGMVVRNTSKGIRIEELNDNTELIKTPERTRGDAQKWYGAVYYDIIPCKFNKKTYYTLLGFKSNDGLIKTRVIDIANIGTKKSSFGAPLFKHEKATYSRRIFAYTAEANMVIRYDAREKSIVFDHLAPASSMFIGEYRFYGPDGTYDTYNAQKDGWHFNSDVDKRNAK